MAEREQRSIISAVTVRAAANGDGGTLKGYAASFNCLSAPLPGGRRGTFRERIAPGAFARSIQRSDDVRALFNHDANQILARVKNGTLSLREDSYGLEFDVTLPDTQTGRDVREMVRTGLVDGCSFGFQCDDDSWTEEPDPDSGEMASVRTLRNVSLFDVSPVCFPAYPQGTTVAARSLHGPNYISLALNDDRLRAKSKLLKAQIDLDRYTRGSDAFLRAKNTLLAAELEWDRVK